MVGCQKNGPGGRANASQENIALGCNNADTGVARWNNADIYEVVHDGAVLRDNATESATIDGSTGFLIMLTNVHYSTKVYRLE